MGFVYLFVVYSLFETSFFSSPWACSSDVPSTSLSFSRVAGVPKYLVSNIVVVMVAQVRALCYRYESK